MIVPAILTGCAPGWRGGHDVEIILVLRRPDVLLEAAYAETILSGPNAPPFRTFLKARWRRFDLAVQLWLWEERSRAKSLILGIFAVTGWLRPPGWRLIWANRPRCRGDDRAGGQAPLAISAAGGERAPY